MSHDRLLYDIETNGLFEEVTQVHCIVAQDLDTDEVLEYAVGSSYAPIDDGIQLLADATLHAGHNVSRFDLPVLQKLYPGFPTPPKMHCTLAMSHAIYPGTFKTSRLRGLDFKLIKSKGPKVMDGKMIGAHSLAAWSQRLMLGTEGKLPYNGGWEAWSEEMQTYCVGDVRANRMLYDFFIAKNWNPRVWEIESRMEYELQMQEYRGVGIDIDRARTLQGDLTQQKEDIGRELAEEFGPTYRPKGGAKQSLKVPKIDRKSVSFEPGEEKYTNVRKGCAYTVVEQVEFKPSSAAHVARRLQRMFDWEPTEFTPKSGEPSITAEILEEMPYPCAPKLAKFTVLSKLLGYLSEGQYAWLALEREGKLHPSCHSTGAVTTRGSHSGPNMGQVPSVTKLYGKECRQLFVPSEPGPVMVGADASGLQLALYAHFLAPYDGGEMCRVYEETGDIHTYMMQASGLLTRDKQKTTSYAKWFGAGNAKLGNIKIDDFILAKERGEYEGKIPARADAARYGARVNRNMKANMKGYAELQEALGTVAERGYTRALDGRHIPVPSQRLALLTVLQGNEAVVMKVAYLLAAARLEHTEARIVLWVHDEIQATAPVSQAEDVGRILAASITDAGKLLGLRLTLGAEYKVGPTWADTH